MKIAAALALMTLFVAVGIAAAQPAPTTKPVSIPRSETFDLKSAQGRSYRVFIAEPTPTATTRPANGYATFFVLDANAMFATAVEAVRFQKGLTPTLIVGIGYPQDESVNIQRRYQDYTPVTPDEHIWTSGTEPRAKPSETGGQDEFLAFIDEVVKPEIAKRYALDRSRQAIFGHSLGGRLVLHAMFTRPESFSHYIAASPSIWWDDRSILKEADAFVATRQSIGSEAAISLLLTVGELEQKPAPGTSEERKRFFEMAKMVDSARELCERLVRLNERNVSAKFVEYPEENHGSVVPLAISRSMRFALQSPVTSPAPAVRNGK